MDKSSPPMSRLSRWINLIPEPFTLALILTILAFLGSSLVSDKSTMDLGSDWVQGLSSILGFSMQMVLCLASGFALAQTPLLEKFLVWLCMRPKNFAQSVAVIALVSMSLGIVHWGLGLAGGALLVRRMRQENLQRGFYGPDGLLGAAGYLPLMVWHAGLSGSAPLLVASEKHFLADKVGAIELTRTIFHWSNLLTLALLLIVLTGVCYLWAKNTQSSGGSVTELHPSLKKESTSQISQIEDSPELNLPIIGILTGLFGIFISLMWIQKTGFSKIGLNHMNALFLFLALLFHARLGKFLNAFKEGVLSSWSVILLYPFYGAIMALVKNSGLATFLSESITQFATTETLPLFAFLSAGLLNIFVPSGGGQWVVQGPIMISAGESLGVSSELMVMSVAYGDQLTNMLQPFWALPLLGLTQISSKELLRYTVPLMFFGGAIMVFGLFFHTLI